MSPRIAVIYHSRRGTVRTLAELAAQGARDAGAEVRLLRVPEETEDHGEWPEEIAEPEDVLRAEGLVLAAPTYYGMVSSPFKRFLESTSPLWGQGLLADRVATCLTASTQRHGGREATLTSLHHTLCHWGCWVAGSDPADPITRAAGGTAYGLAADNTQGRPAPAERAAARALGHRLAGLTARAHPQRTTGRPVTAGARTAATPAPPHRSVLPAPTGSQTTGGSAPAPAHRPLPPAPPAPLPVRRPVRLAVVYHGEDAETRILAQEAAAAARVLGAEVRLRRVALGGGVRDAAWLGPSAAPATAEDVAWADAALFGAPVRLGALAAPLLEFVQTLDGEPGPLWGKPAGGFAITPARHAGAETALLDLGHMLLHAGALLVPPGYTDPAVEAAGGNPYGTSCSRAPDGLPTPRARAAAAHQGRRIAFAGDLLRRTPQPSTPTSVPSTSIGSPA
ncbi:flavodoxin family protein [Streptomyces niveiscabiei]|uniref:flavodoxin family protein n=1 Tax=Streptomyces niveiscabiei TaxID=164115 RepID=UPI0029AAD13E|nr:flavodoxin family protein [Streptomyces niveiscabiei]MDX3385828.1 flavodoxin family protein [Streptomyces niveiscabiei]